MRLWTQDLVKTYRGRKVVNRVSLEVQEGEIVGLLGPNGAGKTTTFYMVVGLIRPQQGRVWLDGEDITRLPMHLRARRGLGYLAQETSIFRKMTVEQNLLAILELQPMSQAERLERTTELLTEFGVEHLRKVRAGTLSGGETRRVEIARALATNPKFILLDEPFTGVDPKAIEDIQSIIADLRKRGIGLLLTDHNVHETLAITDRAYIMDAGELVTSGTPMQLAQDPLAKKHYLPDDFTLRGGANHNDGA